MLRVLVVAVAFAGCLEDSAENDGTPAGAVRVAWQPGPSEATWTYDDGNTATFEVPAGAYFATDERTYLYGTTDGRVLEPAAARECSEEFARAGFARAVLVAARTCTWAPHPSISCNDVRGVCSMGASEPSGPPPTPG